MTLPEGSVVIYGVLEPLIINTNTSEVTYHAPPATVHLGLSQVSALFLISEFAVELSNSRLKWQRIVLA